MLEKTSQAFRKLIVILIFILAIALLICTLSVLFSVLTLAVIATLTALVIALKKPVNSLPSLPNALIRGYRQW